MSEGGVGKNASESQFSVFISRSNENHITSNNNTNNNKPL